MKFDTKIRKGKTNSDKEFYSYIKEGERTVIDFDTKKLDNMNWKIDKWYNCSIEIKDDKIKNIRRFE